MVRTTSIASSLGVRGGRFPAAASPGTRGVARGARRVACCSGAGEGGAAPENLSRRAGLVGLGAAACAGLAAAEGKDDAAIAIGPTDVFLSDISYADVECGEGVPKSARCVIVTAKGTLKGKKPAYNGEVFGRVRYGNSGESALYGDFAEATDAGKISDVDVVPAGENEIKFNLLLSQGNEDATLSFVGLKIRAYPGMSANFRVMKPVADTMEGACDPDYDICD